MFPSASCIKGHRSSSCHHSDRPLFEIKKKGRPVSQCEKCRELRKNKRMHVRCTCGESSVSSQSPTLETPSSTSLAPHTGSSILFLFTNKPFHLPHLAHPRRRLPTAPSLPNGIRDIYKSRTESPSNPHPKQKGSYFILKTPGSMLRQVLSVINLLNPCQCPSLRNCTCSPSKLNGKTEVTYQYSYPEVNGEGEPFIRYLSTFALYQVTFFSASIGYRLPQNSVGRVPWLFDYDLKLPPLKHLDADRSRVERGSNQIGPLLPPFSTFCGTQINPLKGCTCGSACICIGCKE